MRCPASVNQVIGAPERGHLLSKFVGACRAGSIDAKLAGLQDLSPELLDQNFPKLVTGVSIEQVTEAVAESWTARDGEERRRLSNMALKLVPHASAVLHLGPLGRRAGHQVPCTRAENRGGTMALA